MSTIDVHIGYLNSVRVPVWTIVLLLVSTSLLAISPITNVLVNGAIHDHTTILTIGITSVHDVLGLIYHKLIPELDPQPLVNINHVYNVTLIFGTYARLGPALI